MWEPIQSISPINSNKPLKKSLKIEGTFCFCLSLRSSVLAIGLLGATLAASGLFAYAVIQVPHLRDYIGRYNLTTTSPISESEEEYSLDVLIYYLEIIGTVVGTLLGLLVNILLVYGALLRKRWFLVHWLVFHVIALILLFATSIFIFIFLGDLWKLLGLVPIAVALLSMYCWSKVYELFLVLKTDDTASPSYKAQNPPNFPSLWFEDQNPFPQKEMKSVEMMNGMRPAVEFYPVDSLSRGMANRMYRKSEGIYLPEEDPRTRRNSGSQIQFGHEYEPSEGSSTSTIVEIRNGE